MAHTNSQDRYARYGGVHFTQQASPEEINRFVKICLSRAAKACSKSWTN